MKQTDSYQVVTIESEEEQFVAASERDCRIFCSAYLLSKQIK